MRPLTFLRCLSDDIFELDDELLIVVHRDGGEITALTFDVDEDYELSPVVPNVRDGRIFFEIPQPWWVRPSVVIDNPRHGYYFVEEDHPDEAWWADVEIGVLSDVEESELEDELDRLYYPRRRRRKQRR